MNPPSITDVVGLAVFISTLIFSAEVAAVVGPYILIVLAAVVGGSFSLARRQKTTRASAVLFFLRVVGLAVLLTGGIAALTSAQHPSLNERVLLAPVALVVGFIGDDWGSLLGKLTRFIFAAVDLVRGKGGTS